MANKVIQIKDGSDNLYPASAFMRTALVNATNVNTQTTLSDTGITFTPAEDCIVEVYLNYNTSSPIGIAVATKNSSNLYQVCSMSERENTGVTVSQLACQAVVRKNVTYCILAKSASSGSNAVGALIIQK